MMSCTRTLLKDKQNNPSVRKWPTVHSINISRLSVCQVGSLVIIQQITSTASKRRSYCQLPVMICEGQGHFICPREPCLSSYSRSFLRLTTPKFRVHNSPPLAPNLTQVTTVHTITSNLFKNHFNIILPPTRNLPSILLPARFPTTHLQKLLLSSHTCHIFRPSLSSSSDHPNCLVRSAYHEAPQCTSFSNPLSTPSSQDKHLPQYRVLEIYQPMLFTQCEKPGYTPIQSNRQSLYFRECNLDVFKQQMVGQNILKGMLETKCSERNVGMILCKIVRQG